VVVAVLTVAQDNHCRQMNLFFRIAGAVALMLHLACTNAAVDKAVGTSDGASGLIVSRTERGISLQNRAGRPLLNIRIAIESRDGAAVFVHTLPTLDAGASHEVPLADFRTEDGTLFDPGRVAPKQIKTTARDTLANSYDVTTPWDGA
jgi:hypothetical protein